MSRLQAHWFAQFALPSSLDGGHLSVILHLVHALYSDVLEIMYHSIAIHYGMLLHRRWVFLQYLSISIIDGAAALDFSIMLLDSKKKKNKGKYSAIALLNFMLQSVVSQGRAG